MLRLRQPGGAAAIAHSDPPVGAQERRRAGRQPEPAGHYHSLHTEQRQDAITRTPWLTSPLLLSPLVFFLCFVICSSSQTLFPFSQSAQFTPIVRRFSFSKSAQICVSKRRLRRCFLVALSEISCKMLAALCINVSSNNYKCM